MIAASRGDRGSGPAASCSIAHQPHAADDQQHAQDPEGGQLERLSALADAAWAHGKAPAPPSGGHRGQRLARDGDDGWWSSAADRGRALSSFARLHEIEAMLASIGSSACWKSVSGDVHGHLDSAAGHDEDDVAAAATAR